MHYIDKSSSSKQAHLFFSTFETYYTTYVSCYSDTAIQILHNLSYGEFQRDVQLGNSIQTPKHLRD